MTSKSAWKGMERKVAGDLHGKRAMCSGNMALDKSDVEGAEINGHPLAVSCKYREELRGLSVIAWFTEARDNAKKTQRTPLLVIKEKGKRGELVVLSMEDFKKLVAM